MFWSEIVCGFHNMCALSELGASFVNLVALIRLMCRAAYHSLEGELTIAIHFFLYTYIYILKHYCLTFLKASFWKGQNWEEKERIFTKSFPSH